MTQSQWMMKSGGKMVEVPKPRMKISVPRFDNTELIAKYAKTVIGRCMNPPKQEMKNLLFMLPRFWNVEGRVVGTDLGLGRFRFDFDLEEYIVEVLKMEPFHSDHWMVSLVWWKPVFEPNYPSRITFWVRVLDVPMQFWAASTFQSVGEALGKVHGEVDLMDGRVRVELDGFKPLVFSMEVDFNEGVELVVNLRYERMFGFCRVCCCMTHDQSRCPTKVTETEEVKVSGSHVEHGTQVLSYKAAVGTGGDSSQDPVESDSTRFKGSKDGSKGKGIAREMHGSYKHDGGYRNHKDKFTRGCGEGSFRGGRQHGYGALRENQRRYAINPSGFQQLENGEGRNLSDPQKLMLDAFKGVNQGSKEIQAKGEDGMVLGARKSLLFENSVEMMETEEKLQDTKGSSGLEGGNSLVEAQFGGTEDKKDTGFGGNEQPSALDDENLMVEGVLLSDSELLDEEWEEGELLEFMEEMEEAPPGQEVEVQMVTEPTGDDMTTMEEVSTEEIVAKGTKKKGSKTEINKTRLVHKLLSPRKGKISKAPGKNGDKGNGEGKKNGSKP